jgi:XTP/dITP diphosphohydrolase
MPVARQRSRDRDCLIVTRRRLLIASTNPHKVREIHALLDGVPLEITTLAEWPEISAPEETGKTFEDNARQKALHYGAATGELTVAEDSGLEIDALSGAPGVESARYQGVETTYPQKFVSIYDRLRARDAVESPARFVCALALVERDAVLFETRGTIEGRVAREPKGSNGFGYDPIFFYPPFDATLGEATQEQKAAVSHRGKAFRALRVFLLR